MKHFKIFDECFSAELHVLCPASDSDIHNFVYRHFGIKLDEKPEPEGAFLGRFVEVLDKNDNEVAAVIALSSWNGTNRNISTLTHELLHAVTWFLGNRGLKLSRKTDESYCYFLDSLLRRCLDKLP